MTVKERLHRISIMDKLKKNSYLAALLDIEWCVFVRPKAKATK